jgi:hypothetical protein
MSERRYNDDEVAAIFHAAADDRQLPAKSSSGDDGLTLADLQAIGREVGISADAVASAAIAIDVKRAATQRTFLGLPIGVSRTVELNRRITDDEWELLVVRLREVFHARGRTSSEGSLRQWTNGNLHVLLEPTETGQRLRFGTFNAAAQASIRTGLLSVGAVWVMAVATALNGTVAHAAPMLALVGTIGVGLIANGVLRLPRWAKLRGQQMEALAAGVAASPSKVLPRRRTTEGSNSGTAESRKQVLRSLASG